MSNWQFMKGYAAVVFGLLCLAGPSRCRAQVDGGASDAVSMPAGITAPSTTSADADTDVPPEYKMYTHWHAHSGKAAECVVCVQFPAIGEKPALTMSGLVARCDGFLLVPRIGYERMRVSGAKGTVSVIGAENETISAPIPLAGWQLSASAGTSPGYGLVKINNHHVKCLHLLSGDVVKPGMSVNVVFAVDSAKPGLCVARSYTATVSQAMTGREHRTSYAEHYCLNHLQAAASKTPELPKSPAAMASSTGTASPDEGAASTDVMEIPVGATVIDPESGAAIGMVTQAGSVPVFQTMSQFGRVFNDVPLLPSRTALAARKEMSPANSNAMVTVPGGALRLQGPIAREYEERFHTDVACMPDFMIDVTPVTNLQYRTWMQGAGNATPPPTSWQPDELNNPVRRQDLPVLGVLAKCARQYAQDADKRLVTEVEWQRASYVKNVDWYLPISRGADAFEKAFGELVERMRLSREQQEWIERHRTNPNDTAIPVTSLPSSDQAAQVANLVELATGIEPTWVAGQPHPVGFYPTDISPFGVRDVVTNPIELMLPRGDLILTGSKRYPSNADPYLSYAKLYTDLDGPVTTFRYFIDMSPADGLWFADVVYVSYTGESIEKMGDSAVLVSNSPTRRNGKLVYSVDPKNTPPTASHHMRYIVSPTVAPEFRCAR